jgi:type I restriction-modification system DNA methylase subunit
LNDLLKYGLQRLDMIDPKGNSVGLVPVKRTEELDVSKLSVEEIIAIENAHSYGASYIYFRRFKNRPSTPQVYIYDYTSTTVVTEDLIQLHQRLYSSGHVPMFFVFSNRDIRIFNCYDRPAKGNRLLYKPLTIIELAAEVESLFQDQDQKTRDQFKAFSGRSFDNGSFWENSTFSKEFQFANSAYEKLLTELKQALTDIIQKRILPGTIARKILVISILIKYLEERTDEYRNSVFPKAGEERVSIVNGRKKKIKFKRNFFDQFSKGAACFTDVLKRKGAALKLLNYLAAHFNGGVFKLTEKEKAALKKSDLTRFALFLEGNLQGVQYVFWRLYSFNDLPVELISNIYEEFLEKKPGVVYTPPYLVSFLLDEAMPLTGDEIDYKVVDPACGSGVFLVGAFRRLIYRWRKLNNWKRPRLTVLKKLLKENIYGSDKDPEAVNLTIFSLSLALCDELTPLEIWENLEFDDLSKDNIFAEDFFDLLLGEQFSPNEFDLVIGNPPFDSTLTSAAKKLEALSIKNRLLTKTIDGKGKKQKVKVPDNQIALLFLEQSISLCKPGALVCLIQPAGPLLYNINAALFRQYLFRNYDVPQIIDFTHISRVLFGKGGDVATAAVFIKNQSAKNQGLLHVTVRRTKPNKEKIFFELDSYDFHYVPRNKVNDPLIWKANYLGGSRVHQLLSRFAGIRTFGEFLEEKKLDEKWVVREGYKTGKQEEIDFLKNADKNKLTKEDRKKLEIIEVKFSKAPFLTGKNSLAADGLTELGIDQSKIFKLKQTHFLKDWIRQPKIFEPPHVLIGEVAGLHSIPVDYSEEYLSFGSQIIGIHAPNNEKELKEISIRFKKNKFYLFYLAGISGRFMVNKSTSLLKGDIDKLPYPADFHVIELDEFEKMIVDDVVDFLIEFKQMGENSRIALEDVDKKQLEQFGSIYCEILNSVYSSLRPYEPFQTESYICYPFYFRDKPNFELDNWEKAEKNIEKLVKKISGISLRLTRVVRIYDQNIIYLIKPKKLRYWLPSIALRDADETFADLRKQGY